MLHRQCGGKPADQWTKLIAIAGVIEAALLWAGGITRAPKSFAPAIEYSWKLNQGVIMETRSATFRSIILSISRVVRKLSPGPLGAPFSLPTIATRWRRR